MTRQRKMAHSENDHDQWLLRNVKWALEDGRNVNDSIWYASKESSYGDRKAVAALYGLRGLRRC